MVFQNQNQIFNSKSNTNRENVETPRCYFLDMYWILYIKFRFWFWKNQIISVKSQPVIRFPKFRILRKGVMFLFATRPTTSNIISEKWKITIQTQNYFFSYLVSLQAYIATQAQIWTHLFYPLPGVLGTHAGGRRRAVFYERISAARAHRHKLY